MKKKILHYIAYAALSAGIIAAVLWGKAQTVRAAEMRALSDEYIGCYVNSCTLSSEELKDSVNAMRVSLEKLRVTDSVPAQVLALEDIVRESARASVLYSRIPQPYADGMGLAAFITRVGDCARSMSRRLLTGGELDKTDREQLSKMLERLQTSAESLELPTGTEEYDYYEKSADEPSEPEYPELIYDGPFSESNEKAEPKGLSGEEGSVEEALLTARSAAGVSLEYAGETGGRIPTYDFSADGVDISVSKKGLYVLYYMAKPSGDRSGLPEEGEYETFVSAGKAFLDSLGYYKMVPTYAQYHDGTALISFAYEEDGVIIYNDLVKVWLDRETGKPVGLDANNYLFSHTVRELPAPRLTEEEAAVCVSKSLSVTQIKLALIPTSPQREVLCYEFRGTCGEDEYIVYINAGNGNEEQVFKIISDEYGQMTV